tara:strand:+ start:7127 stop:7828 length:702 start_codon:yes stop_codon:yes gene_type:complete
MRILKKVVSLIFCIVFSANCFSQQSSTVPNKIEVLEVIQVNSYTYLRVNEVDQEKWIAVPSTKANVGDFFYYTGGMEMPDFESKELKRTFKSVTFLGSISKTQNMNDNSSFNHSELKKEEKTNSNKRASISIGQTEGVISISKLLKEKKRFVGQKVKIKGKVTKFNTQIMSKNWIHLQDGTAHEAKFDVTITTNEVVKLEDIIILEGIVSINKDFGYGYFYDLLIENAVIINE